jgi:hypothetical protein
MNHSLIIHSSSKYAQGPFGRNELLQSKVLGVGKKKGEAKKVIPVSNPVAMADVEWVLCQAIDSENQKHATAQGGGKTIRAN